jgi:hypothetical protein
MFMESFADSVKLFSRSEIAGNTFYYEVCDQLALIVESEFWALLRTSLSQSLRPIRENLHER